MSEISRLISTATGEIGYLEKKSNSNLDDKTANAGSANYTKYARDLDNLGNFYNGKKNGYAWCDVFVDWCFVTTFGESRALELLCQPEKSLGAGTGYSKKYYVKKGQYHNSLPKKGDQIFFKNSSGAIQHTGLVVNVDSTYVYTIEGNTSGASGVVSNGGGVSSKKYKLSYNLIDGYGRPNYTIEAEDETPASTTPTDVHYITYTVVKGDTLSKIGTNYGVNWKDIASVNGIKGPLYIIHVGQVLNIPKSSSSSAKVVSTTKYIQINTSGGVWCRKGIGFGYKKYKCIPNNTKCELITKNAGYSNGYHWDKIKYNSTTVYVPNKWNKYL